MTSASVYQACFLSIKTSIITNWIHNQPDIVSTVSPVFPHEPSDTYHPWPKHVPRCPPSLVPFIPVVPNLYLPHQVYQIRSHHKRETHSFRKLPPTFLVQHQLQSIHQVDSMVYNQWGNVRSPCWYVILHPQPVSSVVRWAESWLDSVVVWECSSPHPCGWGTVTLIWSPITTRCDYKNGHKTSYKTNAVKIQ